MTDTTAITITDQRQIAPVEPDAPKRKQLGRKLRHVISLMVHEGMEMDKAARKAGTSTRAIRKAFERPHVLAYVKNAKQVFRASISAQNIFHAAKIRNRSGNAMAKLGAIRLIEGMDDEQVAAPGRAQSAGVVIVIQSGQPAIANPTNTQPKPLIEHEDVRHDE